MFSNYIAAPFVFLAIASLYLSWKVDTNYSMLLLPFVLIATLIYVFAPQINWWWYNRRPPELPVGLRQFLERFSAFYKRLSPADQKKFRQRIALFQMGTDWEAMAFEDETVPQDVQLALAHQAVMLTLNRPDFLFERFEKVIVYPRPFPTPEHPYDHASELFEPDSCLIFSAEQVIKGFVQSTQWYNVALHEYARAFVIIHPTENYPAFDADDVWDKLEAASGMPRGHVESVIGIRDQEPLPVAIHHYFTFPERFRAVFAAEANALDAIFKA